MQDFIHQAKITEIQNLSPSVKSFKFQIIQSSEFNYEAGQFVIVSFPEINHSFPYRSYSLASASDGSNFELCVVLKPTGHASPVLFEKKAGVVLQVTKPLGNFCLPDEETIQKSSFYFICTGTGIAPFRAMLQALIRKNIKPIKLTLYFGARKEEDILYREEMEKLASTLDWFHYVPVLSQSNWNGAKGYVHPHYLNEIDNKILADTYFYICGWSEMVKETKNNLKAIGYSRKQIKFELFD